MTGTLEEWKSTLSEMLAETQTELQSAEKLHALLAEAAADKAKIRSLLEAARYNYEFVKTSSGVHNIPYAMDLLDSALEGAEEASQLAMQSATPATDNEDGP